MRIENKQIGKEMDYNNYNISLKEYLKYGIAGLVIILFFSYIFYESLFASIIMLPIIVPYFKILQKRLCKKQQQKLKTEFKECCMSLAAQMSAGYSIENSIREAYEEMRELYGENSFICRELKIITEKLKNNISIEEAMAQLAIRSSNQDIRLFSEVLTISKRSGGDLIGIVKSAALNISEKAEVEREIKSMISEKQLEQGIMSIIPLMMILYVKISSPEMIEVMYQTVAGRIIMSCCLIIYIFAFLLGMKITDIEV